MIHTQRQSIENIASFQSFILITHKLLVFFFYFVYHTSVNISKISDDNLCVVDAKIFVADRWWFLFFIIKTEYSFLYGTIVLRDSVQQDFTNFDGKKSNRIEKKKKMPTFIISMLLYWQWISPDVLFVSTNIYVHSIPKFFWSMQRKQRWLIVCCVKKSQGRCLSSSRLHIYFPC